MIKRYLLIVFLLGFFAGSKAQTTLDTALNFSCKDINGGTHVLFDILSQGKLVVIDFFSTSCGPCATYAPQIQDSYENFGYNTQNVFFLGIAWGDDNSGVHIFDSTYGVTYPSVSGIQGNGNQVILDYNILSYPTVVLIGLDTMILEKHIWPPTTQRIDSILIANGGIVTGSYGTIDKETGLELKLYPMPATDHVNVLISSDVNQDVMWYIYDITARVMHSENMALILGDNELGINISNLEKGNYIFLLRNKEGLHFTRKLIIN